MHKDFNYWSRRAEQHAVRAINASTQLTADIHQEMTRHYTRKALRVVMISSV